MYDFCQQNSCLLFDTSGSNSFIVENFTHTHKFTSEPLEKPLQISIPIRSIVVADKICKSCTMELGRCLLDANLVVFNMYGFNVFWNRLALLKL